MANTPVPFDPVAVVSDPTQTYVVHLLINVASDPFWQTGQGAQEPADPLYRPATCGSSPDVVQPFTAHSDLGTALWDFTNYKAPFPLTGFMISAAFDDGEAPMFTDQFAEPVLVGPGGQPNLTLPLSLTAHSIPTDIPLNT